MCPFILFLSLCLGYVAVSSGFLHRAAGGATVTLTETILSEVSLNFTFYPAEIDSLYDGSEAVVLYNLTVVGAHDVAILTLFPEDDKIVEVSKNKTIDLPDITANETVTISGSFGLKGKRLGRTVIRFRTTERTQDPKLPGSTVVGPGYDVVVLRRRGVVDDVFRYGIIVLASVLYIGFGCKIDLSVIWSIIRRPVSPAIGVCCQFILMPLLSFGISRMLKLDDAYAFGLLAMAASPGGGSSNVWVSLLGGHLDLSLTMTTISTFGALGMMPMWMYLLGRLFVDETKLSIPYMDIFRSLLTIVLPCLVGLVIKRFLPRVAAIIARITRPFSGIFVLYILTFGTYANLYMYIIMGTVPMVMVAAVLLPFFGYTIAFAIALLLRRDRRSAVAISIETGVQNASIPIIMLQGNFPQPEGDLGAVMPVATSLFTQFPIMFAWFGVLIYRKCRHGDDGMEVEKTNEMEDGVEEQEDGPDDLELTKTTAAGEVGPLETKAALNGSDEPVKMDNYNPAFNTQEETRF